MACHWSVGWSGGVQVGVLGRVLVRSCVGVEGSVGGWPYCAGSLSFSPLSLSLPLSPTHRIVAKLALPDARDGGELPLLRGTRVVRHPQRHHQHHHSHMSAASTQHSVGSSRPSPSAVAVAVLVLVAHRASTQRAAGCGGGPGRPGRTDWRTRKKQ